MKKMTYPIFCVIIFRYADKLGLDYWPGANHHDHIVRIVRKRTDRANKTVGIIKLSDDRSHMIVWTPQSKESYIANSVKQAFDYLIRNSDDR